jgi:hypothetical protein
MASGPGRGPRLNLWLDRRGDDELERVLADTLSRIDAIQQGSQARADKGASTADKRLSIAIFMTRRSDD